MRQYRICKALSILYGGNLETVPMQRAQKSHPRGQRVNHPNNLQNWVVDEIARQIVGPMPRGKRRGWISDHVVRTGTSILLRTTRNNSSGVYVMAIKIINKMYYFTGTTLIVRIQKFS